LNWGAQLCPRGGIVVGAAIDACCGVSDIVCWVEVDLGVKGDKGQDNEIECQRCCSDTDSGGSVQCGISRLCLARCEGTSSKSKDSSG
jgi:hypothetical protein